MGKIIKKRVALVGSGFVGQATGKGLAKMGHRVVFYDVKSRIIKSLKKDGFDAKNIKTLSAADGHEFDFFMISVQTPTVKGKVQLNFLEMALQDVGRAISETKKFPVVVIRSTVPPGTIEKMAIPILEKESKRKIGKDFGVCMNPEFLREASSEKDFASPWIIAIGTSNDYAGMLLSELYHSFRCQIVRMSFVEAEMMKYAHNLLNATKISFFNEMRIIGKKIGANPEVIFPAIIKSAEAIWNHEYGTKDFGPYGGSCLPKDTEAFLTWSRDNLNFEMPVLRGTIEMNKIMKKI